MLYSTSSLNTQDSPACQNSIITTRPHGDLEGAWLNNTPHSRISQAKIRDHNVYAENDALASLYVHLLETFLLSVRSYDARTKVTDVQLHNLASIDLAFIRHGHGSCHKITRTDVRGRWRYIAISEL